MQDDPPNLAKSLVILHITFTNTLKKTDNIYYTHKGQVRKFLNGINRSTFLKKIYLVRILMKRVFSNSGFRELILIHVKRIRWIPTTCK